MQNQCKCVCRNLARTSPMFLRVQQQNNVQCLCFTLQMLEWRKTAAEGGPFEHLAPHHHHSTPLLEKLHWLPISERIKYNVTCMCFNAFIMSFTNCIQTHEGLKRTFNTTRHNVQIFRVSPFYKQQQLNGEQWNIGHLPCFRMLAVILVSNLCFQRMHLWQSLRTLHLHASQARVVVGDSASLLLYLCCVFQALINSLACWFCTSALGLVLFLISVFPIY